MFDPTPDFRHQLAAERTAALQRSAERLPAGPLRHAIGCSLVRIGLWLRSDGRVPSFVSQLDADEGLPIAVGAARSPVVAGTGEG